MSVLATREVHWAPKPNIVTVISSDELPPQDQITSSFVFAFDHGRLVMMEHVRRGLDLPGGHVEPGEAVQDAASREFAEETGLKIGRLRPFAFQKVEILGEKPEGYRYPFPVSYQAFFLGSLQEAAQAFLAPDSRGVLLLAPESVRASTWYSHNQALFELAWKLSGAVLEK